MAILHHTRDILFLTDDHLDVLSAEGSGVMDHDGRPIPRPCSTSPGPRAMTQNPGYGYFMRKETLEQPRAVRDTLATTSLMILTEFVL